MKGWNRWLELMLFFLLMLTGLRLRGAGTPVSTDDPMPVDLHHYEFYIFGAVDGTPAEIDSTGPAFEFNWGLFPERNYTPSCPGERLSVEQSCLPTRGNRAERIRSHGHGAWRKSRHRQGDKRVPQIGTFTMFEIPTGSYDRDLAWARSGTSYRSGCKRTMANGCWMEAELPGSPAGQLSRLPVYGMAGKAGVQ